MSDAAIEEDAMTTIYKKILLTVLTLFLLTALPVAVQASGRMFFSAMVEPNEDMGNQPVQIVLHWGPLDGKIPAEIATFRLYRSQNDGPNSLIAEIEYTPDSVDSTAVEQLVESDLSWRRTELINSLQTIRNGEEPAIDANNYASFLHTILTDNGQYAPFQKMMLTKHFPAVAMALGRSYIDRDVSPGNSYVYMLTAVDETDAESNPLGQTDALDPTSVTQLPAPGNFQQVLASGCDGLRKGVDDKLIRFTWDVPAGPAEFGRSIQTLGYDIFWAASDQSSVNLSNGIPTELHKINPEPITVSGPSAAGGLDGFLAMDRGENHIGLHPEWKRGQTYYYYVVPIDILGRYGGTSDVLEATVVDGQPPRAIWGVATTEVQAQDPMGFLSPRLALSWDRMDGVNFVREYGLDKTICSADKQQICFVQGKVSCKETGKFTCEDFDIDRYAVFRYDTPEEAMFGNGMDSDGDLWIDALEDELNTDSCDSASHPAGDSPGLVVELAADDPVHEIEISPGHVKISYVDMAIGPDQRSKVFWYRVVALDSAGNAGPVSPPIRGILYNRTQPVAQAFMQRQICSDYAYFLPGDTCSQQTDPDDLLLFFDQEKQASRYTLWKQCPEGESLLSSGAMNSAGVTHFSSDLLAAFDCKDPALCSDESPGSYFVTFFDMQGSYLSRTDVELGDLCSPTYQGCAVLEKNCDWENLTSGGSAGRIPENGKVQVCVQLEDGQMARIYQDSNSDASPFAYITTDGCDFSTDSVCESCEILPSPQGLTAADYCVGVRVFSKDHVGSTINHLGCLEMPSLPRMDQAVTVPPPMLASVNPVQGAQSFEIRWAAQESRVEAFTMLYNTTTESRVLGISRIEPGQDYQFAYTVDLADEDLNKEWCFKIKGINSALESSDWSNEICAAYETVPPDNTLGWPAITLPAVSDSPLAAFYLDTAPQEQDQGIPVIVLSEDLSARLTAENSGCVDDLQTCPGPDEKIPCLGNTGQAVNGCRLCDLARTSLLTNNFIVYRQAEGEDFVQVSPLIEKMHCVVDDSNDVRIDILNDPFIYLVDIQSSGISGVSGGVDPGMVTGARLIFRDRYPHIFGRNIRYKILSMDPGSGEIKKIYSTNWININLPSPPT